MSSPPFPSSPLDPRHRQLSYQLCSSLLCCSSPCVADNSHPADDSSISSWAEISSDHRIPRLPDTFATDSASRYRIGHRPFGSDVSRCPTSLYVTTCTYSANVSLHPLVTFLLSAVFTSFFIDSEPNSVNIMGQDSSSVISPVAGLQRLCSTDMAYILVS